MTAVRVVRTVLAGVASVGALQRSPSLASRHVAQFQRRAMVHAAAAPGGSGGEAGGGVQPWRERIVGSIARSRKIRGGNYVQLATVDAGGAPRVRTVVFRGFSDAGDLKIITDARSSKVAESARVEVCWWFSQSSEQYRFSGAITYVGAGADGDAAGLRKQTWGNLSDGAREQFFWTSPPRDAFDSAAGPEAPPTGGRDADGKVLPAPDNFLIGLIEPAAVDYLRLTDNFRQIDEATGGAWAAGRVHP